MSDKGKGNKGAEKKVEKVVGEVEKKGGKKSEEKKKEADKKVEKDSSKEGSPKVGGDLPNSKFTTLEEELSQFRSKELNFNATSFEPTNQQPGPPPAFGNDFSFAAEGPENSLSQNIPQRIRSAASNRIESAASGRGSISRDEGVFRDPEVDIRRSAEKREAYARELKEQTEDRRREREERKALEDKDPYYYKRPQNRYNSEVKRKEAQDKPQEPKQPLEQYKGTLAYSLFNIPQESPQPDALDEYLQQERDRELDFFKLNKQFNDNIGKEEEFSKRLNQLTRFGTLGQPSLSSNPKPQGKIGDLMAHLEKRGVIECRDIISQLPFVPISSNPYPQSKSETELRNKYMNFKLQNVRAFQSSLHEKSRRLRDYEGLDTFNTFL